MYIQPELAKALGLMIYLLQTELAAGGIELVEDTAAVTKPQLEKVLGDMANALADAARAELSKMANESTDPSVVAQASQVNPDNVIIFPSTPYEA